MKTWQTRRKAAGRQDERGLELMMTGGWKTGRQGDRRQENLDERGLDGRKTGGWKTGRPGRQ